MLRAPVSNQRLFYRFPLSPVTLLLTQLSSGQQEDGCKARHSPALALLLLLQVLSLFLRSGFLVVFAERPAGLLVTHEGKVVLGRFAAGWALQLRNTQENFLGGKDFVEVLSPGWSEVRLSNTKRCL